MICIIAAMEEEVESFLQEYQPENLTQTPYKIFLKNDILLVISGIGLVNSACATTYALTKYPQIKTVINVGTCGSIDEKLLALEPVVVTEAIYSTANATAFGYDYGQIPRMPKSFKTNYDTLAKNFFAKNFKPVIIGSADYFVHTKTQAEKLDQRFSDKISVVDMECAAIVHCAYNFSVPILVFKIVSDSIFKPSSAEQFAQTLKKCSEIICKNLLELINILQTEKVN